MGVWNSPRAELSEEINFLSMGMAVGVEGVGVWNSPRAEEFEENNTSPMAINC